MARSRRVADTFFLISLSLLVLFAAPVYAQTPRPASFLAAHYDVSATLDSIGQSISATAKIDFKAVEAASSVRVELHPNLIVKDVKGPDGKPLNFERDRQNPLFLTVQLASPVATDGHVTLTFTYAGLLLMKKTVPFQASVPPPSTRTALTCFCLRAGFRSPISPPTAIPQLFA
jgi:hypothetical protein